MKPPRRYMVAGLTVCALLSLSACGSPNSSKSAAAPKNGPNPAVATSAAEVGGLDALIAAAKKEGQLNVVSFAPDWANFATLMKTFETKYGIKINDSNPEGSSQDEIDAAKRLDGTGRAPDVFDLGVRELANSSLFAPYKVSVWSDIPAAQKDANGLFVQDYGGYMAIGYDSSKVPPITSVQDLLKPQFKGKVALFADPTTSNSALTAVMMVSVANGGSLNDVSKGVDFFAKLKKEGNFVPVAATNATVANGTTPVVLNWDYLAVSFSAEIPGWKLFISPDAAIAGYYNQAINKKAPHPAAARLWEEYLFSDQGQNILLQGGARPVRMDAMTKAGTIDKAAAAKLPPVTAPAKFVSLDQAAAAKTYLTANWAKAVG